MRNSKAFKVLLSEYTNLIYEHAHARDTDLQQKAAEKIAALRAQLIAMFQETK